MSLVLASGSIIRAAILRNAGLDFAVDPAELDERAAEEPLLAAGMTPEDLALTLASAKALLVSERRPGDLVIGADQVLDLDGERMVKPPDMEAARTQLLRLAGRTHALRAGIALARDGEVIWEHVDSATLTMRALTPAFVGRYLAAAGPDVLSSVGAYQIEGRGIQLFERIEGDTFAVLGLPLLPLLAALRREGALE